MSSALLVSVLVEVQVRPADRRQLHPDDRVVGVLDAGLVLLLDPQLVRAAVRHRAHSASTERDEAAEVPDHTRPETPERGSVGVADFGRARVGEGLDLVGGHCGGRAPRDLANGGRVGLRPAVLV